MPLGSVEYENIIFRCFYGDDRATIAPASFTVHLFEGFTDDPDTGARVWTELDATGGYVPPTVANTTANFPVPTDGEQEMNYATIQATGAFSGTAYYAGLKDPAGVFVEYARLAAPLTVTAAGEVRIPLAFWHENDDEGA